jgi:hypothetical protein
MNYELYISESSNLVQPLVRQSELPRIGLVSTKVSTGIPIQFFKLSA